MPCAGPSLLNAARYMTLTPFLSLKLVMLAAIPPSSAETTILYMFRSLAQRHIHFESPCPTHPKSRPKASLSLLPSVECAGAGRRDHLLEPLLCTESLNRAFGVFHLMSRLSQLSIGRKNLWNVRPPGPRCSCLRCSSRWPRLFDGRLDGRVDGHSNVRGIPD